MNYEETKEFLTRYLKARIPVIIVKTVEKNRVLKMLKDIDYEFNLYSMSNGIVNLKTNAVVSEDRTIMSALDFISNEIKHAENRNFVLSDISDIGSSTNVSRYLLDIILNAEKKSGTIIIITNEQVWTNISRFGISLHLDYPMESELEHIIRNSIVPYEHQLRNEWDDNDYKKAANYLQGLSEMEVKNIISSIIIKGEVKKEDLAEIKKAKKNLFSEIAGLEEIDVDKDFEIAGLDNLKQWLNEKKNLLNPSFKAELKNRGMATPRGILLTGVPGCGKSLCSKATAKIFDVPLYRLDLATVQGEYVGQSERQLKEALEMAEYVSPCVLWIDEIEKGLKESSSGVTSKMIGQFLFWLQECDKPVFVVASANSVEELPPELIRKGRFDEIFFVDLPNAQERRDIINLYLKNYLRVTIGDELSDRLVRISEGYASSDIEATIRSIAYKLIADPNEQLTEDLIERSLTDVYSLSKTNPEKISKIREWGRTRAISASVNQ